MNIFVTGSSGFIGKHLLENLARGKHKVTSASRRDIPGYLKIDLQESRHFLQRLEKMQIEVVVNLAWHTNGSGYLSSPANHYALEWSKLFFEIIKQSSVKKVLSVGSSVEYETHTFENSSLYSITKLHTHKHFLQTFSNSDKEYVWLRPFQVYGPGQSSTRFVPLLTEHIRSNRSLKVMNPQAVRDWIDVRDVAEAIRVAIERIPGGEVDVGTGQGISVEQICNYASQQYGLNWDRISLGTFSSSTSLIASASSPLFSFFKPRRKLFDYLDYLLI